MFVIKDLAQDVWVWQQTVRSCHHNNRNEQTQGAALCFAQHFPIIQHNSKFATYNVLQLPAGTITQTPKYLQISTMSSNDAQKEIEQELKVVQKMYEDSFITREQLSKIQSVIFNHTAPTSIAASDDTSRVLRSNSNVTIRPRKRALDRCQINFAQVG